MLERRFERFCGEFTSDMGLGKDHVLALMTKRIVSVRGPGSVESHFSKRCAFFHITAFGFMVSNQENCSGFWICTRAPVYTAINILERPSY